jgi:hypothetical protein
MVSVFVLVALVGYVLILVLKALILFSVGSSSYSTAFNPDNYRNTEFSEKRVQRRIRMSSNEKL